MDTISFFYFLVPCAQGHNKVTSCGLVMPLGRRFCMQVYTRLDTVVSNLCLFCNSFIELSVLLCHGLSLKGEVTADMVQEYQ
jgi:hypothetical protein